MANSHYPVMNKEVLSVLGETDRDIFLDCTVGMGGHASIILDAFPGAELIAVDADNESLKMAKKNMKKFGDRVKFYRTLFTDIFTIPEINWERISGILVDPGLSVVQIKNGGRGFSHSEDSYLDMRKDKRNTLTAHEVINNFSEAELTEIFRKYGEIGKAKGFAKRIIERRLFGPIDTSIQLRKIVEDYFGWRPKKGRTHPAAKIFQSLRIFVNGELEGIDKFIESVSKLLKKGARVIFLSFHSTEDRVIKKAFKKLYEEGEVKLIKPFPMKPLESEIRINNPSRSAKLRAIEKI